MARLPDFSLTATDGRTFTPADLRGRPHVLYATRHVGCTVCQARLRTLLEARGEIAARGAGLVVVLAADAERARAWQRREGAGDVTVLADPERRLATALRAGRPGPARALRPRVLAGGVRNLLHGRAPRTGRDEDPAALGADVVLDADARVASLHRPATAGDRRPPAELLAELERLAGSVARV